ncbi:MAG: HAD family hydrolase [Limnospira sp.]
MPDRPTLLALDFDGVVCDGLIEYFQTAWRTYLEIWSPSDATPPEDLPPKFYQTRPVIETGWEMPLLVKALISGVSEAEILANWHEIRDRLVEKEDLQPQELGPRLDRVRDDWISADLDGWLGLHRFYPGVCDRIRDILDGGKVELRIITTKEERFVRSLLEKQGIHLPSGTIFGKGHKQPKHQTLRDLLAMSEPSPTIWFVEDRLKTLLSVQRQPDLDAVQLFLADWGYNTEAERASVAEHPPIRLLSLAALARDFSEW